MVYDRSKNKYKLSPTNYVKVIIRYNEKDYHFISHKIERGLAFLPQICSGEMDLLKSIDHPAAIVLRINDKVYFIGKPMISYIVFCSSTGKKTSITEENFKTKLPSILNEKPEIANKIGKRGYKFKNMIEIIDEFNRN